VIPLPSASPAGTQRSLCRVPDKKYSAKKPLSKCRCTVRRAFFAECFSGFAECFRHSAKQLIPVVPSVGKNTQQRRSLPSIFFFDIRVAECFFDTQQISCLPSIGKTLDKESLFAECRKNTQQIASLQSVEKTLTKKFSNVEC
jgi:hypothetical protein